MADRLRKTGPCAACGGKQTTRWIEDAWVCRRCGAEWYPDPEREPDKSGERNALRESGPAPALDRDALRREALDAQMRHDPTAQQNGYQRCELCHYTRHPCEVYDLATTVLALLDEGQHEYFT